MAGVWAALFVPSATLAVLCAAFAIGGDYTLINAELGIGSGLIALASVWLTARSI